MIQPAKVLCLLLAAVAAGLFTACSIEPEPIAYGSDACDYCRMNIVDKTHAAQLVTSKGKQFKYDAIECLVRNLPDREPDGVARVLVADYAHPGRMTDARTATYLISEGIKSPMGANLSAFSALGAAETAHAEYGGMILGWEELPEALKGNRGDHAHGRG